MLSPLNGTLLLACFQGLGESLIPKPQNECSKHMGAAHDSLHTVVAALSVADHNQWQQKAALQIQVLWVALT
jgi:hypothetical protein